MRPFSRRTSNYELVYSTRNIKTGSRDGSAGDRPQKRRSGSRRGGAGTDRASKGYTSEGSYSPADVLKKQQEIRKRGEDKRGEGDEMET